MMEELLTAVANVGFPIAISAYLLTRFEKKLDDQHEVLTSLKTEIEKLSARLEAMR